MENEWDWKTKKENISNKERRNTNELWRIWWTICTTRTKRAIK